MSLPFYDKVRRWLLAGRAVAIATVIHRQGSAPRDIGAKMLIGADGSTAFSIGGGAFEALVVGDAREALRRGEGFEKEYRFTQHGEGATGMVCGGAVRVLVEVIAPAPPLVIFGAGHVGRALARLAVRLGFMVTVVDDRERELRESRFPAAVARVRAGVQFKDGLPPVPEGAYVAIVTRCHETDLEAVRHAVGRGAAYVGLIGSRRKVKTVVARAIEMGTPREALATLRAPIGLPIAAETPDEIAVSIAAEMIAVRRGGAASEALRGLAPFPRRRARRLPA